MRPEVILEFFQGPASVSGANLKMKKIDPQLINAKRPKVNVTPSAATIGVSRPAALESKSFPKKSLSLIGSPHAKTTYDSR